MRVLAADKQHAECEIGKYLAGPQCRNKYNVYKSRGKNKDGGGNVIGLPNVHKLLEDVPIFLCLHFH